MDKIGKILKDKRLELGITVEEVSQRTRLTVKHIKAIEEGDISYFKDDLSYLRFFLKAYCDVLGLDFENFKGLLRNSIDEYTTSFSLDTVRQHEQIELGIQRTNEMLKQPTNEKKKKKPKKAKRRRRFDISLLSFLAIIFVILIGLMFAVVMIFKDGDPVDNDISENRPPVAIVDDPYSSDAPTNKDLNSQNQEGNNKDEKPIKLPDEKKEMEIKKVSEDASTAVYTIENLKETDDIDVEITFGCNSTFRALADGKEKNDPIRKQYNYKDVIHVREKAVKGKKIQLAFGFMLSNTIKVNGKNLEIPTALSNKQGSGIIELNVKGE